MSLLRSCALLLLVTPTALPAAQDSLRVRQAILVAEDLRPTTPDGLAPILAGLASADTVAQRLAVRALGRLERAELVADIAPLLRARPASVRAEAANALGQAVARGDATAARRLLEDRLAAENDPFVRGVLFRTLGRLPIQNGAERDGTERLLVLGTHGPGGDAAGSHARGGRPRTRLALSAHGGQHAALGGCHRASGRAHRTSSSPLASGAWR